MDDTKIRSLAETAALYAILCDDPGTAHEIVDNMPPGERATFSMQLSRLLTIVEPSQSAHNDAPSRVSDGIRWPLDGAARRTEDGAP